VTRNRALRTHLLLPGAQALSEKHGNRMTQFEAAGHLRFRPFPPPPRQGPRPDLWRRSFRRCWTAAGFQASVHLHQAQPTSMQARPTLGRPPFATSPASPRANLASHARSKCPLPKAGHQTTERNASTPICSFPTARRRARFCADLPLGPGRAISEGYPLVLLLGVIWPGHTMDPHAQGSSAEWPLHPSLC